MLTVRHAKERGYADHGWLESLAQFLIRRLLRSEARASSAPLRVINEDRVPPGQGFGTHATATWRSSRYVLEGAARTQGLHGQRFDRFVPATCSA